MQSDGDLDAFGEAFLMYHCSVVHETTNIYNYAYKKVVNVQSKATYISVSDHNE
jgi:hypothetical protein